MTINMILYSSLFQQTLLLIQLKLTRWSLMPTSKHKGRQDMQQNIRQIQRRTFQLINFHVI